MIRRRVLFVVRYSAVLPTGLAATQKRAICVGAPAYASLSAHTRAHS